VIEKEKSKLKDSTMAKPTEKQKVMLKEKQMD